MTRYIRILIALSTTALAAPVHLVEEAPVSIQRINADTVLVDFGRVSFGNIKVMPSVGSEASLVVHFGEDFTNGRINRKPRGTVRYAKAEARLNGGAHIIIAPKADKRNTQQGNATTPPAVLTPEEWGVILPFRWVEIDGWPGELRSDQILRRSAYASTWDDRAAFFESSDEMLNRIWELCRYSIKATTFAGVYVDGDRERIPYEADAYINQICHYYTDNDIQMARDTYDWLMKHPTWPTEWASHMVFMAYADYMHTGDNRWLTERYEALKPKLLLDRARPDGLLVSTKAQMRKGDIVDWPQGERDGFKFTPVNSVINAFHIRSLQMMAELAKAIGKKDEAAKYEMMASNALESFQKIFFVPEKGAYRDGEGTDHTSQHASLFPLAFGLVPEKHTEAVLDFVGKRGMACSVYAAQYLMEGLFMHGGGRRALELMSAPGDRSWRHMVDSGATITWEAWDHRYKPNQDWNHAWGAAPGNLLPRYVLGVEALKPGWKHARIRPYTGSLVYAKGKIPTPLGPVEIGWENKTSFQMRLQLPPGMTAQLELPAAASSKGVFINSEKVPATRKGDRWHVDKAVSGNSSVVVD